MATFEKKTTWGDAQVSHGLGGLLGAVLSPMRGFGSFCLVVLSLSVIANNVLNIYSVALSTSSPSSLLIASTRNEERADGTVDHYSFPSAR